MKKRKLKVLIVDDEKGMCIAAHRVINDLEIQHETIEDDVGFEAEYVTSINEFNQNKKHLYYDLYLLDFKLSDGSGLDLLDQIKKVNHDCLIILITAYATFETAVQATKKGAFDFLAKPFTPTELRFTLNKATQQLLLQRQAKEFEEEKKKIRFEFISILSHELKAPISAVEGYLEIMKDRYEKIKKEDYERFIKRSSDHESIF